LYRNILSLDLKTGADIEIIGDYMREYIPDTRGSVWKTLL